MTHTKIMAATNFSGRERWRIGFRSYPLKLSAVRLIGFVARPYMMVCRPLRNAVCSGHEELDGLRCWCGVFKGCSEQFEPDRKMFGAYVRQVFMDGTHIPVIAAITKDK